MLNSRSVFISYAREDFQYAEEMFYFLKEQGFDPWMDKKNLLPGQNWQYELEERLRKADFILILISSTSISKRGYVQREYRRALEYWEERPMSDIYLIPVKIDECDVPTNLAKYHWAEYSSPDFRNKIVEAITSQAMRQDSKQSKNNSSLSPETRNTFSDGKTSKQRPWFQKLNRIIFSVTAILIIIAFIGNLFPLSKNNPQQDQIKSTEDKEAVYNFIVDYFKNIGSIAVVERFFADKVDTFYLKNNLTKEDIIQIRLDNDIFVDAKHKIDK